MMRSAAALFSTITRAVALGCGLALVACGGAKGAAPASAVPAAPSESRSSLPPAKVLVAASAAEAASDTPTQVAVIPVSADDPQWGQPLAPVTIVGFSEFQCPFCSRVNPVLKQVRDAYGERVRLVFKHNPLPFHERARPAAEAAATVYGLGGSRAFWKFHDLAFAAQRELSDGNFEVWAATAGVAPASFKAAYAAKKYAAKVDADLALAAQVGASGTPGFRINGVTLSGAQPFEKFKEVIDRQLAEAEKLRAAGTPASQIYAALTNLNHAAPPPPPAPAEDADATVWKVPVMADDPVRGPKDAPVTIIVFSEFQCPFCKRVEETLAQVSKTYGAEVRLVWKDNPLPFHPRALPAAAFARFAYAKLGEKGFWAAHEALLESAPKLEDEDFALIAKKLGLPWQPDQSAKNVARFRGRLEQSVELAADFQARGTPHFFINGVRLSGAQPFEKFQALIDRQLAAAQALKAKGVAGARLYEQLIEDGQGPPRPETKEVAAPDSSAPFRGNPAAKVVIQEWSDFQCPYCARVQPTLRELEKEYPGQLKLVFRHLPLPFHKDAPLAAEAAQEAFAQKGNAAFWSFHAALFAAQAESEKGLSREHLEQLAREARLDLPRFKAALDSRQHEPKVRADAEAATQAGISGTPAFVINGYFLSGAQPAAAFKKLIRAALTDTKNRVKVAPARKPALP